MWYTTFCKGGGTLGGKNSYESIKRYEDKAYDKVLLRMPKGRKAEIQSRAENHGQSVNGFINEAIDEKLERDSIDTQGGEQIGN